MGDRLRQKHSRPNDICKLVHGGPPKSIFRPNGAARAGKQVFPKPPLYHRNPIRFWQVISLILLVSLRGAM